LTDDLKLDAIGLHLHFILTCRQYGQRWQGSRCMGPLHDASWSNVNGGSGLNRV